MEDVRGDFVQQYTRQELEGGVPDGFGRRVIMQNRRHVLDEAVPAKWVTGT